MVVVLVTGGEERARADGLEGISLFPPTGPWRSGVELEAAGFRLAGRRGSYEAAIGRLEWAPNGSIALRARVPVYTLSREEQLETQEGLGDTELRLRIQLKKDEPLRISGGWVTQLPTGSQTDGLGAGALQVTPFLSAGFKVNRTILYVTVADALSLAGPHQPRLANWVDPGTDHELRTTVGAIFNFTELVSASAIATTTTLLVDQDRGRSLVTGAFQLGTQPDRRLRIVLAQQLPLLGEERFSWKLNAAATFAF